MKTIVCGWLAIVCVAFLCAAPAAVPVPGPAGLLQTHTLYLVYGRAFGVAPILGKLGTYSGWDRMAADTRPVLNEIETLNGKKPVALGVDLIYGMATPCLGKGECLNYLDSGKNIVEDYIKPAAQRGAVVILDTQLGRSTPVEQVRRMIEKGYLKYDNVHVAIDPEFHAYPGHAEPGIPIGTITAQQVNETQSILNEYVRSEHLPTKKILIIHQFGDSAIHDGVPVMIGDKKALANFPNVELVIDMDGLGGPPVKVFKYNTLTDNGRYPAVHFRGIKVFYRSAQEKHGHFDRPPLTMKQVFGEVGIGGKLRIEIKPNVVIVA